MSSVTSVQYAGQTSKLVNQSLEQGEVAKETKEAIFRRRLEERMKTTEPVVGVRGKVIEQHEPRGYDSQGKLIKRYEFGELGKKVDIQS